MDTQTITRETPSITIDGKTYLIVQRPNGGRIVMERRKDRPPLIADTRIAVRILEGMDVPAVRS